MADDWEDRSIGEASEEEDVKDNWDEDSEEEKPKAVVKEPAKKSNLVKDKTAEKEKQKETLVKDEVLSASAPVVAGLGTDSIDKFEPTNWEEFVKFNGLLKNKLTRYEHSEHYAGFLDEMFKTLCKDVELDSLKRLSDALSAISNEKAKLAKSTKTKKKTNVKANLKSGKNVDMFEQYRVADNTYDDYDDYM